MLIMGLRSVIKILSLMEKGAIQSLRSSKQIREDVKTARTLEWKGTLECEGEAGTRLSFDE